MSDFIKPITKSLELVAGEKINLPTIFGTFELIPFLDAESGKEHVALIKGNPTPDATCLVRIHSSCATGDLFGSLRCDCGNQLHLSMQLIEKEGCGILIYLQQEGRGIGLMEKMKAYKLQEDGIDTVDANLMLGHEADERDYHAGAIILQYLSIQKIRLLTNNPEKRKGLEAYGLLVKSCIPVQTKSNPHNAFYLKTKKERMGHLLA